MRYDKFRAVQGMPQAGTAQDRKAAGLHQMPKLIAAGSAARYCPHRIASVHRAGAIPESPTVNARWKDDRASADACGAALPRARQREFVSRPPVERTRADA
jgi:hypothetical protein